MVTALGLPDCSYDRICVEIRSRHAELEIFPFPVHHPEQVAALRFIQTCCQQTQPKNAPLEQAIIRIHFQALECASLKLTANHEEAVVCLPKDSPCNKGPIRLVTLLWGAILHTRGDDALEETYLWRELCLKVIEIARQTQFTEFYPQCRVLEKTTHRRYCYTMEQLNSFATEYPVQLPTLPLKSEIQMSSSGPGASTSEWRFGIDERQGRGITYEQGSIPDTILVSDSVVRGWIEGKFHKDVMAACGALSEFALWPPGLLPIIISYTSYLRHIAL